MSAPLDGPRDAISRGGPPGLDRVPGGWFTLSAFAVALIACIAASIAYYLNPSAAEDELAAPPSISAPPTAAAPGRAESTDPSGTTSTVDVEEFRAFAMGDRPFPPEWLVRVKKVYWTDSGELRANAQMPSIARERAFTIQNICEALSNYVAEAGRPWHGVSVRDLDGDEVRTRVQQTDSCTPGE
jgi:hypothetical protein